MNSARACLIASGMFGLLAVILGAYGSHGLARHVDDNLLGIFNLAVEYQMYHALALGLCAALLSRFSVRLLCCAGFFFTIGIVIFSGSLYLYVLSGNKVLGMVTPVGGLMFMLGWVCLIIAGFKGKPAECEVDEGTAFSAVSDRKVK